MVNSVHMYPDILKYADIIPVFKKGDTTDKTNYRCINTRSSFSKVFEKLIYAQKQLIYGIQTIQTPRRFPCKTIPNVLFLKWLKLGVLC